MDAGPPLRDVACFVRVAQRLSFSAAAADLGMSQPAVSQTIARLERALGVRLFVRTSREVQLTDAGKMLLPHAEALIDQAAGFAAEAARLAVAVNPVIRLAYDPLIGTFAARVARRLANRSPGVEVELRAAGWSVASADLAQGVAPAALIAAPFPAGLARTARFQVPVTHLAVPAGSPLATTTRLRLDQLRRQVVLLPRVRPPGSVWARLAALLPASARSTTTGDDLDDPAAALDLVAAGRGLLPVPGLLAETIHRPDIQFLPLDAGGLALSYALVWRPEHASPELMALVQTVQALLRAGMA